MHSIIVILWLLFTPLIGDIVGGFYYTYLYREAWMLYSVILCNIVACVLYYIEFCVKKEKSDRVYFIIVIIWSLLSPLIGCALGDLCFDSTWGAWMLCSIIACIIFYVEYCYKKRD